MSDSSLQQQATELGGALSAFFQASGLSPYVHILFYLLIFVAGARYLEHPLTEFSRGVLIEFRRFPNKSFKREAINVIVIVAMIIVLLIYAVTNAFTKIFKYSSGEVSSSILELIVGCAVLLLTLYMCTWFCGSNRTQD